MRIRYYIGRLAGMVVDKIYELRLEQSLKNRYYYQGANVYKYLQVNPMPQLSEQDKLEIDAYWKQFGIKFSDYSWFQWYYGITNVHDPRFIPPAVHAYVICPYYNNENFFLAWKDKNLFERFLPEVHFPKAYLKRINGRYFDSKGNYLCGRDAICEYMLSTWQDAKVIVKDTWDSGEGRGVAQYRIHDAKDVEQILEEWEKSNNYL